MFMDKNEFALLNLIKYSLSGNVIETCDFEFEKVVELSNKHGVFSIVYKNLFNLAKSDEVREKLKQKYGALVSQALNQEYYSDQIFNALDKNGICHLPLKGARIKNLYPAKIIRFSSDIDIFIKDSDKEKLDNVMKGLSFKFDHVYDDEISFILPPYLNVEFHTKLDYNTDENYYKNVWEKLEKTSEFGYSFSDNDFYINFILHLYKHFSVSGTGVRSAVDVFILNKELNLNREYINAELEKFNLVEFEKQFVNLAKAWLDSEPSTPLLDELGDYVLNSGIYGNIENRTSSDMSEKHSKFGYFMLRVFPPYRDMLKSYPSLKKCPILLPFYWIARIFRSIFFRRDKIKSSVKAIKNSNDEKIYKQRYLFEQLKINK